MAGGFKRAPAVTGLPAIPTPANTELAPLQQALNNIRARFEKLEAAMNKAYNTLDASSQALNVEALQTQVSTLQKQLDVIAKRLELVTAKEPVNQVLFIAGDVESVDECYAIPGPPGPPGPPGQVIMLAPDDPDEVYFPLPT